MDLDVGGGVVIPGREISWRFSRSSGPGGQHVNSSDSRVELLWDVHSSTALTPEQRGQLLQRLNKRVVDGVLSITAAEQRSQLRNREIALAKFATLVASALAPAGPARRPSKPTRGSKRRHQAAKQRRSETKSLRRRPADG
ncbi:alternative ribosome rescue aminoacyl-tRNA hydrolase ArfB [Specibacter sp. NPDC057265]|uniref:alternative ribosome rescue aminoacyl-tRNA hydrolase ArfB n=1 Tax=Specibacter sp. NPDC057265 TaxID=3346075 RepID=UPI00363FCD17